jgi:sugar phosphate isomerase/epimerase
VSLRLAYNTNGTQNHRLLDALALIAEAGYDGVALTLDVHHLDPFARDLPRRAEALARRLAELELGCVIETGARDLLDPRAKHEPTLVSPEPAGRMRRIDFLRRAVDVAEICGAEAVSLWAGATRAAPATAWPWLVEGLSTVVAYARPRNVTIAFEPEPGMLVETVDDFERLAAEVEGLTLALDTGHCLVTGEREPPDAVREFAGRLGTVAIEDMRRGEHLHLPFGEGDMDVSAVVGALEAIGFGGLVCVELSRDSHRAHTMVPAAHAALRAALT